MCDIINWARLLAFVTGLVNQELLLQNEYLAAENRILRCHLPTRLRLCDAERCTLAEIGKRLGRKGLKPVACTAQPDTILAWYRRLIARKFDGSRYRAAPGRPRVEPEVAALLRPVESVGDDLFFDGLRERRPARMRFEFLRRIEKDSFTAKAGIDSPLKEAAHFRAEGSLRACLPGYVVFLFAQLRAPFGVRLDDLAIRRGVADLRQIENIGPLEHHGVF